MTSLIAKKIWKVLEIFVIKEKSDFKQPWLDILNEDYLLDSP